MKTAVHNMPQFASAQKYNQQTDSFFLEKLHKQKYSYDKVHGKMQSIMLNVVQKATKELGMQTSIFGACPKPG